MRSIAYGANGDRLEAYATLRRRVAAAMVSPHNIELP